jgi:hypothetical protein
MANKRRKQYTDWVQGLKCFFGIHNFVGHWKNEFEYYNEMLPDKLMCVFCGVEKNISESRKFIELNKLKESFKNDSK